MRSLVRNPDIYESPLPVGLMDEDEMAQVGRGLVGWGGRRAWRRLRAGEGCTSRLRGWCGILPALPS
jgi:hypothetical protein